MLEQKGETLNLSLSFFDCIKLCGSGASLGREIRFHHSGQSCPPPITRSRGCRFVSGLYPQSPKKQHGEYLGFSRRRVHTRAGRRVRRHHRPAARSEQPRGSQPPDRSVSGPTLRRSSCGAYGPGLSRDTDLLWPARHRQLHGKRSAATPFRGSATHSVSGMHKPPGHDKSTRYKRNE